MGFLKFITNLFLLFVFALFLAIPAGIVYGLKSTTHSRVLGAQSEVQKPYQKKYIANEFVWVKNITNSPTKNSDLVTYTIKSHEKVQHALYELKNITDTAQTYKFRYLSEVFGPKSNQRIYLLTCRKPQLCDSYLVFDSTQKMNLAKSLNITLEPLQSIQIGLRIEELSDTAPAAFNSSCELTFTL